jgi:hypothetical protein
LSDVDRLRVTPDEFGERVVGHRTTAAGGQGREDPPRHGTTEINKPAIDFDLKRAEGPTANHVVIISGSWSLRRAMADRAIWIASTPTRRRSSPRVP